MVVTLFAFKVMPQPGLTLGFGNHPSAIHPGGIMADMLVVSTGKLCDPMAFSVGMKTGD
jgi:hypothetical protein